jgi:hypothetical protein
VQTLSGAILNAFRFLYGVSQGLQRLKAEFPVKLHTLIMVYIRVEDYRIGLSVNQRSFENGTQSSFVDEG